MSKDNRKWVDWIKELPSWVKGAIGFVTVIIGFVLLWRDNPDIVPPVLLGLFVVGGILGSLYLAFKRTEPLIVGGKGTWQYPHLRHWAIASCIFISLLTILGTGYYFYEKAQPPDKIIILVAEFDGIDPKNYRVTETLLSALRQALKDYDDVTIIPLRNSITEQQGSETARVEGEKHKATIVIWGWYGVTENSVPLSVNFEILRLPEQMPKLRPEIEGAVRTLDRVELESFDLQTNLSGEMSYITLMTVGVARYAAEDWSGSIIAFEDALKQTSENIPPRSRATTYIYIGNTLLNQEELVEPNRFIINSTYGESYYENRGVGIANTINLDTAIKNYSKAIELNPSYAEAYNNRGVALFVQGKLDEAIDDFAKAIQYKIKEVDESYNYRGLAYIAQGETTKAITDFTKAIEINNEKFYYYVNRGGVLSQQEQFDKAIDDYNKAIELNPNLAEAYVGRGNTYQAQNNLDEAIDDFNKALELDPNGAYIYYNRGNARSLQGEIDEAVNDYKKAIELNPKFAEPYIAWGIIQRSQDNLQDAVFTFTKAIEIDPYLDTSYVERGYTYGLLGDSNKAKNDYLKAIEVNTNCVSAYNNLGNLYYTNGDFETAIDYYTKALEIEPDYARGYFHRGNARGNLGDLDGAIEDYTLAIKYVAEDDEDFNFFYLNRGGLLYTKGDIDGAIADFTFIIKHAPDYYKAYILRGVAYTDKGQKSEAIKDFEYALTLVTDQELRQQIEDELKKLRDE